MLAEKLTKEQEFVITYIESFTRSFAGLELEYLGDFYDADSKNETFKLSDAEVKNFPEHTSGYTPGKFPTTYISKRCKNKRNTNILFASIFTIKLGAVYLKEILENIYRENFSEGAADKQPIEPTDWPQEKRNLLRSIEDKDIFLAEFDERLKETKEELSAANNQIRKDEEQIISLKNDLKIERERIKSLENEVIKLEKLEKNKTTSEITNSSKQKSKTKTNDRRRKSKKKKSSTQEIKKGKITEIPVKTTSDDKYLDDHFAAQSRDLKFYDFPAYWKDEMIYEMMKKVGYIERLEVKWNYKYKTIRARIRLTKEMEEKFQQGGSNIVLTKNDRMYFFRMFDAKLDSSVIKRRYGWQAYRKLDKEEIEKKDDEIIKDYNKTFGGHFAKLIRINKIKYILIYFNNENDLMKAIYKSTMEEDLGKGLKIKLQDELIGEEGTYKRTTGINRFKVPAQTNKKDKFVDARSDILSTIPRMKEEHQALDD
ncbi:hypothetical protein RhiirA5_410921 [Rhizophagus irregularis]|uniref:Uncharacterized protein n=1 Tax=Rhizophagus irregularis TaxID=588596 RepID=A0A2I1ESH9_9GLOM|nr:hypothetical protein RhiirA5_497013 [Rhizophagus irregularis]PKC13187.1 hypothetical protein RhiirA5_410921 [Rhizophagus irregularis]PKC66210.1 hypothetical protein RhiirA1_535781 [Rhizophagus irregularis]PKY25086.1 hypothetical protein RhiirB3_388489 [Rhizophagus irregularis]